jgi:hypothetical protein
MTSTSRNALIVVLCSFIVPTAAFAGCDTRHAYNKGRSTWAISFDNGSTCSVNGPNRPRCGVQPGQTAELHYQADIRGNIILTQVGGCSPTGAKRTSVAAPCIRARYHYNLANCYLWHSGDTSPFVLNDPASGDVQLFSAGFRARAATQRRSK